MRRGYTLIQLLITIVLIGVVISWLLPRVEKVRPRDVAADERIRLVFQAFLLSLPLLLLIARFLPLPADGLPDISARERPPNDAKGFWRGLQLEVRSLSLVWWLIVVVEVVGTILMPVL